jgi:hypothetical protein
MTGRTQHGHPRGRAGGRAGLPVARVDADLAIASAVHLTCVLPVHVRRELTLYPLTSCRAVVITLKKKEEEWWDGLTKDKALKRFIKVRLTPPFRLPTRTHHHPEGRALPFLTSVGRTAVHRDSLFVMPVRPTTGGLCQVG